MDSAIESRLAEVFAAAASTIPTSASERLAHIDYRPRRPRISRGLLGAAGGVVGGATAITAALLVTSSTPAFAGWTSTPAKATRAQLADANSTCAPELSALAPPDDGWAAVTTDVRGPYTLVVYEDSSQDYATCFSGSFVLGQATLISGPSAGQSLSAAANFGPQPTFVANTQNLNDPAGLETFTSDLYTTTSHENYTVVNGQVASGVTSVTLNLNNGQIVGTTLGGGWLVAWWPGSASAASATVTTPSGTSTVPLN